MNITVNIESVNRTSLIEWSNFTVQDNKDDQPNFLTFTIKCHAGQTYKPSAGDTVEVLDSATKIFAGTIVQVRQTIEAKVTTYQCTAKDKTLDIEKVYITERYNNMTVDAIIADMATNYLSGITTSNVDCPIVIETIAFVSVPVSRAIQQLARLLNYSWYVDYDGDIHFFAKNQEPAPFDLTDAAHHHIDSSLEITDDISQLKNRVTVRGAEMVATNTRTKTHIYSSTSTERTFATDYKFASIPTVKVNTVTKTVGVENLDKDVDFQFMWDFNQKYIRATSGITLVNNDKIEITSYPYIPIFVQVEDSLSILELGGDPAGVYEFEKVNKEIKSEEEAKQYAEAQIEAYANQIREGGFQTYDSGLKSGQTMTINLTGRGINDKFVIQRVTLNMRKPNDGVWSVDLATYKTIGIITYLQNQLLNEKITINEDEILKKFYLDNQFIQVTELITTVTKKQDYQSVQVTEDISKDPFGAIPPLFVLAPHTVSGHTDQKREFQFKRSYLSTPQSEHDVLTTTKFYWPMNGTAGSTAKKRNRQGLAGYNLTEVGTPTAVAGFNSARTVNLRTTGAYGLNGTSQYLTSVNALGGALWGSEGTLELWVRPTAIASHMFVLDDRNGSTNDHIYAYISLTGQFFARRIGTTYSEAASSAGSIVAGQWHYVAITWKQGFPVKIYINAVLAATAAANLAGATTQASSGINIGKPYYSNYYLNGYIDEIILSNYEKTVTELANYYALINQ